MDRGSTSPSKHVHGGRGRTVLLVSPSSTAGTRPRAVAAASHIGILGPRARLEVVCELFCCSPPHGGASRVSGRDSIDALPRPAPAASSCARTLPIRYANTPLGASARPHGAPVAPHARFSQLWCTQSPALRAPAGLACVCGRLRTRRRAWTGTSRGVCHARNAPEGPEPRVPRVGSSKGRTFVPRQPRAHPSRIFVCCCSRIRSMGCLSKASALR